MNETIESIRVLGLWKYLFLSFAYSPLSKAMHAANLHHAEVIHRNDGSVVHRCDWCGMSRIDRSGEFVRSEMCEASAKAA